MYRIEANVERTLFEDIWGVLSDNQLSLRMMVTMVIKKWGQGEHRKDIKND